MSKENVNGIDVRNCDIVQDLLPLYYDDACSKASRTMVEEHLAKCSECRRVYDELKNDDIDSIIKAESKGILERHEKRERNAAYKAGVIIAGLLLIPVLITFIVGLASGIGLDVFAIVTASMLLVAAITVVPLMSKQKRFVKCILTGVLALLMIFFFVDRMQGQGEFILWSVPTVFGLSVAFFPFVIRGIELPPVLADKKALITMLWDTLWLYLTIVEVCGHSGDMDGMKVGCIVSTVVMAAVWICFVVARYLKTNVLVKSGIILMVCGLWTAFSNDVCRWIIEGTRQLTIRHVDFADWNNDMSINANVYVLTLIVCAVAGAALTAAGIVRTKKN